MDTRDLMPEASDLRFTGCKSGGAYMYGMGADVQRVR